MDLYLDRTIPSRPISGKIVIPYQAGLKLNIHKNIALNGAIGVRYSYTDYIDKVPNWNKQRNNDGYITYMAGFSVYFFRRSVTDKSYRKWYGRCVEF